MLALIFSYWDEVCLVEQDVGRHQHWVREQSHDRAIGTRLLRFIFELRHPACFTESGHALHYPTQLIVLWNVRLKEERALRWIDTDGKKLSGGCKTSLLKNGGFCFDSQ
jgi:hypothetical protein